MTLRSKYAKVGEINREEEESRDDEGQGHFMRNPVSHRPYDVSVCHSRSSRNNLEAYEHCRQIMKTPRQYKYSNDTVGRRLINRNNNEQQYLKKDEIYKEWRTGATGVEYYRTSDKPKIDWQTKQQMDVYGLLGGCCKKGDHFSDKTHKCRRTEQTSHSRARSLSRPSRDKTRKSLQGILKRSHSKLPVRSRSVCFSDKNEEFLVEYDSDEEDMSEHDLESGEVIRPDTESKNANAVQYGSQKILSSEVAERRNPTGESMCNEQRIVRYIKPAEKHRDVEKNYGNPKLNAVAYDLELQLNINEGEGKFHGFSEDDKSNEMAQLELRTFIIQMENKHEEACEEFAQNYYDVIMETTLGDYSDGFLDNAETRIDDLMDVQNDSIVFIPENDSTYIEDIYEDILADNNMIEDNNETIVALEDIRPQFNSNKEKDKEKLELVQTTHCNKKPCTKDNKNCQSLLKLKSTESLMNNINLNANIRENVKIENRNSEICKADVTAVVDSSSKFVPAVGVGSTDTVCNFSNASDLPGEAPCITESWTELPAVVSCSTCCSVFLSASIGLEQMLEDRYQWQCQDCAICILCFVRTQGDGLFMCCKCGRHYHKACVRMEEEFCRIFVCKFCTPEEDD